MFTFFVFFPYCNLLSETLSTFDLQETFKSESTYSKLKKKKKIHWEGIQQPTTKMTVTHIRCKDIILALHLQ